WRRDIGEPAYEVLKTKYVVIVDDVHNTIARGHVDGSRGGRYPIAPKLTHFRIAKVDQRRTALQESRRGRPRDLRVHGVSVAYADQHAAVLKFQGIAHVLTPNDILGEHGIKVIVIDRGNILRHAVGQRPNVVQGGDRKLKALVGEGKQRNGTIAHGRLQTEPVNRLQ